MFQTRLMSWCTTSCLTEAW